MLYECQLVSENFETDPEEIGRIQVKYDRKTRWSRPVFPFGEVKIPTKEWIEEFAAKNAIGVWCSEINNQNYFAWLGFTIYRDKLPQEAMENFAYRRVHLFTEHWRIYTDDKAGVTSFNIEHKDGTKIVIERSTGAEEIRIEDGVFGNTLVMDLDGVKINGQHVLLQPLLDWLNAHQADFGLGNLAAPVPFNPATTLVDFLAGLLVPNEFTSKNTP